MVGLATVLLLRTARLGWPAAPVHLSWWELAGAFVLGDLLAFHLDFRESTHTFTLTELPLVLGVFFASPAAVIVGRVVGGAVYLGIRRRRMPFRKFVFNLSVFVAEAALAVAIFRTVTHDASPLHPATWFGAALAVVAADALSSFAVSQAIRWYGGKPKLFEIIATGAVTATVNVSLALLVAVVLWTKPLGMLLFASVVGVLVATYRGYTKLNERYAGLQLLYDFTRSVGASMRAETVTHEVLDEARRLLKSEIAEVVLFDRASHRRVLRQRNSGSEQDEVEVGDVAGGDSYAAWQEVIGSGQAIVVPRTSRSATHAAFRQRFGVRDAIISPLRFEGPVTGALMVANRLGDMLTFDEQDRRLFETLANHASVAFENGRLVEELRREAAERSYEASHDALTGLPNRAMFMKQVEDAIGHGATGISAVMLMDLDRFKEVNDTLGHNLGDTVLQQVSERLIKVVSVRGAVARLGGDEFAVLLPDIAALGEAEAISSRIIDSLAEPILVDELSLEVGASIGIALSPEHGTDAATLLQRSDVAMYAAKGAKTGSEVYSFERDDYSPRRLALAADLRRAIENGDITLHYQPKARLADGAVIGTEALARWQHPTYGFVPPDEFIPLAEHTGLISSLTIHVLRGALRQCAIWRRTGYDLGVAVNLAARSLLDTDLPELVSTMLDDYQLPPTRLTLELTETSVMADPERSIVALERLAAIGIKISVDDFGAGYSSLAYLQRLPVQEVKIDKSFVLGMSADPNDAIIVESIVELGHNLHLSVTAEGVEDELSWNRLRAMTCDVAQGYYLSKPVPPAELTAWLTNRLTSEPSARDLARTATPLARAAARR